MLLCCHCSECVNLPILAQYDDTNLSKFDDDKYIYKMSDLIISYFMFNKISFS